MPAIKEISLTSKQSPNWPQSAKLRVEFVENNDKLCTLFFLQYELGYPTKFRYRVCDGNVQIEPSPSFDKLQKEIETGYLTKVPNVIDVVSKASAAITELDLEKSNQYPFTKEFPEQYKSLILHSSHSDHYKTELKAIKDLIANNIKTLANNVHNQMTTETENAGNWGTKYNNAVGGKPKPAFKKTEEKRKLLGRERCVYTQGRKKFIKVKGEFVAIASLKLVAKHKK